MQLCHELGLDIDAVSSIGLRAIPGAANRGSNDIIEYLATNGARLDVADNEGRTPLISAEGLFLATHPPQRKLERLESVVSTAPASDHMAHRLATTEGIREDRPLPATTGDHQELALVSESKRRPTSPKTPAFGAGLDNVMGYNLRRAHGVQKQRFAAVFGPLAIRPVTLSVLGTIYDHPGIKQSDLGKRLNIKRANMVPVMTELEGRGLIQRRPSDSDRRAHVVTLTPSGRKFTTKLLELHDQLEEDTVRNLGIRERDQLIQLLKKFRRLAPEPDFDDLD